MGNRAVITIKDKDFPKEDWNSLYLHWNGGRDSVEPFFTWLSCMTLDAKRILHTQ